MTDTSNRPIAVGDFVVAVRGHSCFLALHGGIHFVVAEIIPQTGGGWYCAQCLTNNLYPNELFAARRATTKGNGGVPIGWLKRIPPLEELESTTTDEPTEEKA